MLRCTLSSFKFQQLTHYDEDLDVALQSTISNCIFASRKRGYSFFGGTDKVPRKEEYLWWIQSGDPTLFEELETVLKKAKKQYTVIDIEILGDRVE